MASAMGIQVELVQENTHNLVDVLQSLAQGVQFFLYMKHYQNLPGLCGIPQLPCILQENIRTSLVYQLPISLYPDLLTQHYGQIWHPVLSSLQLMVWMLYGQMKRRNDIWKLFDKCCLIVGSSLLGLLIWPSGNGFQIGCQLGEFSCYWPIFRTFQSICYAFNLLVFQSDR